MSGYERPELTRHRIGHLAIQLLDVGGPYAPPPEAVFQLEGQIPQCPYCNAFMDVEDEDLERAGRDAVYVECNRCGVPVRIHHSDDENSYLFEVVLNG